MHFLQAHEPWVVLPKGRKKLSLKNKTLLEFQFASLLTEETLAINQKAVVLNSSEFLKGSIYEASFRKKNMYHNLELVGRNFKLHKV